MTDILIGGVEGGASVSTMVLYNGKGECLAQVTGPGTNFWILGKDETRKRIAAITSEAKSLAKLPEGTSIDCMCLSLSGAEECKINQEFEDGFFKQYPALCRKYVICSDTAAPVAVVHENGGVVLIAGTGSNSLLINPDGSEVRCGGWGHIVGDEGSAFWISQKAIKLYFDDEDLLNPTPCGYSTQVIWETIRSLYQVNTRQELLKHLYKEMQKSHIAKLCKELSEKAYDGDPLCKWVFEQAGKELAKHLQAISKGAQKELLTLEGGLPVVCVGSVWKSWSLLKPGFMTQIQDHSVPSLKEFSLLSLKTPAATGAVYLAARAINYYLPRDYSDNYNAFFHFKA